MVGDRFNILTWIIHNHNLVLSSIHKYVHKLTHRLIYPSVSFHGFALAAVVLFLADAADMGGVCWRGLWVKVCLSGPAGRRSVELKVHVGKRLLWTVSVLLDGAEMIVVTAPSSLQDVKDFVLHELHKLTYSLFSDKHAFKKKMHNTFVGHRAATISSLSD